VAIDKDIEQTTTIIQKIEELISQAKIEKGVNNIYKEAYKNKVDEDENSKKNDIDPSISNIKNQASNPTTLQVSDIKNIKNGTVNKSPKFTQDGKMAESPEHCKNCRIF